jgi:peroxiredoxin
VRRPARPTVLIALLVATLLALGACSAAAADDSHFQFTHATPLGKLYPKAQRKKAENSHGELLGGGRTSLAANKGKIVVLNFWGTWCPPCRVETPQFDRVYRKIHHRGVNFLGIDVKDSRGNAKSFVHENDISYPIIYDHPDETALRLGDMPTNAMPFTVLIDRSGRVAAVYVNAMSPVDLRNALHKLLAER